MYVCIAPAVAGTVSVRTVDACGQKSEASVQEVDLGLVTTDTPDEGNNGTDLYKCWK